MDIGSKCEKRQGNYKGRSPGQLNDRTIITREVFSDAFIQLGGVPRLVKWAQEKDKEGALVNMGLFYSLFAKVLPKEVKTDITVRTHEQFIEMLNMDKQEQVDSAPVALLEIASEEKKESNVP